MTSSRQTYRMTSPKLVWKLTVYPSMIFLFFLLPSKQGFSIVLTVLELDVDQAGLIPVFLSLHQNVSPRKSHPFPTKQFSHLTL